MEFVSMPDEDVPRSARPDAAGAGGADAAGDAGPGPDAAGDAGPDAARGAGRDAARDAGRDDAKEVARRRRRLTGAIRESLRDLSIQLALLNHQVGGHVDLKGTDLECLDLISRYGPLSPSALARRSGLHAATMTGILDRLERGGWIARDRDPSDRRAVVVRALRGRGAELLRLYSGMNASLDRICAGYGDQDLELIGDFLRQTAQAGRSAVGELAEGG
ncbi:MAG: MarR family transcriptional regulator [Micromonosporaceae bacterium]